jgi:hypothetical protein
MAASICIEQYLVHLLAQSEAVMAALVAAIHFPETGAGQLPFLENGWPG